MEIMTRWKHDAASQDIDVTTTPVSGMPDVVAAQHRLAAAVAEAASAETELRALNGLLSPYVNQDKVANEIECIRARLAYPQVQQRQLLAEAEKI